MSDVVAVWEVPLSDKVHHVEFEHGTTTGKRVVRVDGEEIIRRDWMFKLVGAEPFFIGKAKCNILIAPIGGFAYEYSLTVNGKQFQKFRENQSKIMKTWLLNIGDQPTRIVLEKDTLDVWVNGQRVETAGEFVEDGAEIHFSLDEHEAYIRAISSGNKREGIIHTLIVDGLEMPEGTE